MAFPGEIGWIGKSCPDHGAKLICTGMRSAAGWFLGTYCAECRKEDPSPHSRETHYYQSKDVLLEAAFADKVQWRDTKYRPGPMLLIDDQLHTAPVVSTYSGRYAVNCPEHVCQMKSICARFGRLTICGSARSASVQPCGTMTCMTPGGSPQTASMTKDIKETLLIVLVTAEITWLLHHAIHAWLGHFK
jgi:hypothetical protein